MVAAMAQGLRFTPPAVELTAELVWMLRRAFAPPGTPGTPVGGPVEPLVAVDLARRFEVSARIAARQER